MKVKDKLSKMQEQLFSHEKDTKILKSNLNDRDSLISRNNEELMSYKSLFEDKLRYMNDIIENKNRKIVELKNE